MYDHLFEIENPYFINNHQKVGEINRWKLIHVTLVI